MKVVLVLEIISQLKTVHPAYLLKFRLNNVLSALVELWLFEVKRAKLERRLEHKGYPVVENLVPEEDSKVELHELIFDVQSVPAFLLAIVLQCQVLHIEVL